MATADAGDLRVSLVIPTHNRCGLLKQVLSGLAEQRYPSHQFEAIVVVDGSTDGTADMLRAYNPPYLLTVLHQPQAGPAAARNAGIAAARGRAVIFLDDDVIPTAELVGAHASYHESDDRAVVIGRVAPCRGGTGPGWEHWEDAIAERTYRDILDGTASVDGRQFYTWNVSVGRRCLDEVGGFDPSLAYQEDVDLGLRLAAAGAHFYFGIGAIGYHCGHRPDFAAWCRRHYRFGYYRMVMQLRDKIGRLGSLRGSYCHYHPLTRLLLRLTIGRPTAGKVANAVLRATVVGLDRLQLRGLSRNVYSALANLHYWRGVADASKAPDLVRKSIFNPRDALEPIAFERR